MDIDIIGVTFGVAFLLLIITNIYFVRLVFRVKGETGFTIETGKKLKEIVREYKNKSTVKSEYDVTERDIKIFLYSRRIGFLLIGLALVMYLVKFW